MAARSLTAAEDYTHIEWWKLLSLTFYKLDYGHSVSVREQLLDFRLVIHTLGRSTLTHLYRTLKSLWQLWLISGSCDL